MDKPIRFPLTILFLQCDLKNAVYPILPEHFVLLLIPCPHGTRLAVLLMAMFHTLMYHPSLPRIPTAGGDVV